MISVRVFAWTALTVPGVVLIVLPASRGELGVDPLKELFHRSGETAIWTISILTISRSPGMVRARFWIAP
jgi:hypothetical protein